MKKNSLLFLFMTMATMIGFTSCDDDDKASPNAIEKEVEIDATAYDKWVYISFENGAVVGTSAVDANRDGLDWDIAFHRWDVRLNCGESGSGKGGALLSEGHVGKTGWDAIKEAPTEGYKLDAKGSVSIGHRKPTVESSKSTVITGGDMQGQIVTPGTWLIFSHTNGPSYEITNQIFVVKTASGKYAKIWLKQYVNDKKDAGYITMKYAYQEDGTTKLN